MHVFLKLLPIKMNPSFFCLIMAIVKMTASLPTFSFVYDGNSIVLTCTTTDFSVDVFFENTNTGKGGCLSSGFCSTLISGYQQPTRVGTTVTSMRITTCDLSRDAGDWKCTYGGTPSNKVKLSTCSLSGPLSNENCEDYEPIIVVLCTNLVIFGIASLVLKRLLPPPLRAYDLFMYINYTEEDVHWRGIYMTLCDGTTETRNIYLEEDKRFKLMHDSKIRFEVMDVDLKTVNRIKIGFSGSGKGRLCHLIKIDIFKRGVSTSPFTFNLDCWITHEHVIAQTADSNQPVSVTEKALVEVPDNYTNVKWKIILVMMIELFPLVLAQILILALMYAFHCQYRLEVVLPVCILGLTVFLYAVQTTVMFLIYKKMYIRRSWFADHEYIKEK